MSLQNEIENLKTQLKGKMSCVTIDSVTPKVLAPGMYAIDVELIPPRCKNNREVHLEYLKHLKESVATICEIIEEARVERPLGSSLASAYLYTKRSQELVEYAVGTCPKDFNKRDKKQATTLLTRKKQVTFADQCETSNNNTHKYVVQIVLWDLDSGCSKHMTGDRLRLRNFMKKFIWTVRFRNDHFGTIMGYEDYVLGDNVISRVYYVEGLDYNLFSIGQFCDSDLEVSFRKHTCFVRDLDGVNIIKGSRGLNLYIISVEDMMSSHTNNPPCPSVSISFDQDAPSKCHSPSYLDHQFSSIHHGVAAEHSLEVNPFAPANNEPFINTFSPDPSTEVSSSEETSIADSNQSTQPYEHL
nr:integrase, catalytic region, zinc finger, CCHC-type, peptidase aspartic, catalytic [Tanacetum cinerariifolium]